MRHFSIARCFHSKGEGKEEGGFAAPKGSQLRLAALGNPFRGKGLAWTLPPSYGRRCPEGAEVGWGWRYEKERERSSQARRLRKHPIHRCAVPPSPNYHALRRHCERKPLVHRFNRFYRFNGFKGFKRCSAAHQNE